MLDSVEGRLHGVQRLVEFGLGDHVGRQEAHRIAAGDAAQHPAAVEFGDQRLGASRRFEDQGLHQAAAAALEHAVEIDGESGERALKLVAAQGDALG